jgi:hypothetical protein
MLAPLRAALAAVYICWRLLSAAGAGMSDVRSRQRFLARSLRLESVRTQLRYSVGSVSREYSTLDVCRRITHYRTYISFTAARAFAAE